MKRLDLHVHLAGFGDGDTGCCISPRMARSPQIMAIRQLARLSGVRTDADYADRLVALADTSTSLDYVCLFAMDGVYDAHGDLVPRRSHLFVPNAYVVEVAKRSPRLLPVISINPQRRDALEELARWGPEAVLLKWLPPAQHFDPSDPRYADFRQLLCELDLPVICHSGTEHTLPGVANRLGDPALCEPLLKLGVRVVFAHCGTCTVFEPWANHVPSFGRLLATYEHAYGDTAGFCTIVRYRNVFRFSTDRFAERIVHGSDYPVPTSSAYFWRSLGIREVARLERIKNPLDKDAEIKRAAGMPDDVFTRAYTFLEPRIARIKNEATNPPRAR